MCEVWARGRAGSSYRHLCQVNYSHFIPSHLEKATVTVFSSLRFVLFLNECLAQL